MASIVLNAGLVALIDDADVEDAARVKWHAQPIIRAAGGYYVYGSLGGRKIYLHRYLMRAPDGCEVDHINGDCLDNRRENMRLCSRSQNQANKRLHANSNGFKGVFFEKHINKYRAILNCEGKRYRSGYLDTAEEAARAYDRLALRHFGDFASFNFPCSSFNADAENEDFEKWLARVSKFFSQAPAQWRERARDHLYPDAPVMDRRSSGRAGATL